MSGTGTTRAYRINAEETTMKEEQQSFWKRTYKTVLMRAIVVAGIIVGGSVGYGIVHWVRSPAKPYECKDRAEIRLESQSDWQCDPGQRLETTRLNNNRVLMNCWCSGHSNQ